MAFNKVILIGNLTANPELKQTQSGLSVCSFTIAVNRKYNRDGNNEVDFFNIQTWRHQAEFISKHFTKGMPILVCGQLQNRSWTDKDGNKRIATEVVADEIQFVGRNESTTDTKPQPSTYTPSAYQTSASPQFEELSDPEGLPF